MENSITIDAGVIRLVVNKDPERAFEFNPRDMIFVECYYNMLEEFEAKQEEYLKRAKLLEDDSEMDSRGAFKNTKERIKLLKEVCVYFRGQIDSIFGKDTSKVVFGKAMSLEMIVQFLNEVTPYIEKERQEKMKKYAVKKEA